MRFLESLRELLTYYVIKNFPDEDVRAILASNRKVALNVDLFRKKLPHVFAWYLREKPEYRLELLFKMKTRNKKWEK